MTVDLLAPELLTLILQAVDCPRDLYSLISAIPALFRVFSTSPELVLASVLQNALAPHLFHHAVAYFHVPAPVKDENDDINVTEMALVPFLDKYFHYEPFAFPRTLASMTIMSQQYLRTLKFSDDYFARAIRAMELNDSDGAQDGVHDIPTLSSTERARLQRAFFRYELYSKIFALDFDSWGGSLLPAETQFARFISEMEPWEVEELSCVHQYFTSILGEFLDDLENQLVEAVVTAPGAHVPPEVASTLPSSTLIKLRPRDTLPGYGFTTFGNDSYSWDDPHQMVGFECLGLPDLVLFSTSGRIRSANFLTYMASLGSEFINQLILADKSRRRSLIRASTPLWRDFLPDALEFAPNTAPQTVDPSMNELNEDPSHANLGYYLYKRSDRDTYTRIHAQGGLNAPLRERGYVFWDSKRLRDQRVRKSLRHAQEANMDEIDRFYNRFIGDSPEKRLKGVLIPRIQMERINAEFGSTFEHF